MKQYLISVVKPYLVTVGHVLELEDDWQAAVPPVVHAGVKLPVQGLEIVQSSSDEPPPVLDNVSLRLIQGGS